MCNFAFAVDAHNGSFANVEVNGLDEGTLLEKVEQTLTALNLIEGQR